MVKGPPIYLGIYPFGFLKHVSTFIMPAKLSAILYCTCAYESLSVVCRMDLAGFGLAIYLRTCSFADVDS